MSIREDIELEEMGRLQEEESPCFIHRDVYYTMDTFAELSREDLLSIKVEIEQDISKIKDQIANVKANTSSRMVADPQWLRKANSALRHKGRGLQMLGTAIAISKTKVRRDLTPPDALKTEEEKKLIAQKQQDFERRFVDAAKLLLTEETFARIIALARIQKSST